MALLFPWATKEYLLWEMSLGQIVMYHNLGLELKYGGGRKPGSLRGATYAEVKAAREEARRQLGMKDRDKNEATKATLRAKYGDIG